MRVDAMKGASSVRGQCKLVRVGAMSVRGGTSRLESVRGRCEVSARWCIMVRGQCEQWRVGAKYLHHLTPLILARASLHYPHKCRTQMMVVLAGGEGAFSVLLKRPTVQQTDSRSDPMYVFHQREVALEETVAEITQEMSDDMEPCDIVDGFSSIGVVVSAKTSVDDTIQDAVAALTSQTLLDVVASGSNVTAIQEMEDKRVQLLSQVYLASTWKQKFSRWSIFILFWHRWLNQLILTHKSVTTACSIPSIGPLLDDGPLGQPDEYPGLESFLSKHPPQSQTTYKEYLQR